MAEGNSVKQEVPCAEGLGAFFFLSWDPVSSASTPELIPSKTEIQLGFQDYLNSFALYVSFYSKIGRYQCPPKRSRNRDLVI